MSHSGPPGRYPPGEGRVSAQQSSQTFPAGSKSGSSYDEEVTAEYPLLPAPGKRAQVFRPEFWICIVLFCATFAVYAQVRQFAFINFDDRSYVEENVHVRNGLTAENARWALTATEDGYWYPVTRLSQLVTATLFGVQAGAYHLTNLLYHASASVLLFLFLLRATKARWRSAFVAFLFALHPLHVESVAWVAELSDVLCAVFWFLTLLAWVRYTESPGIARYSMALTSFALGLMAKPLIVTLPCALLLLDFWPLKRGISKKLLLEKLPFFALSGCGAVMTYVTQHAMGAVIPLADKPLTLRLQNVLVSWMLFLGKFLWPARLSLYYLYPERLPLWEVAVSAVLLAGITVAIRTRKGAPWLLTGWLWYLVTFLPTIGLVQVGGRARTDHSTYIPCIGLSVMLAWGVGELARRRPACSAWLAAGCALACAALAWATGNLVHSWRNTETVFRHAIELDRANYEAWNLLGEFLAETPARLPEAIEARQTAVRVKPDSASLRCSLGSTLMSVGRTAEAEAEFRAALRISPRFGSAHNQLGMALALTPGRLEEAVEQFRFALRDGPDPAGRHNMDLPVVARQNLAAALKNLGRTEEAIQELQTSLRHTPNNPEALNLLGSILTYQPGRLAEAVEKLEAAVDAAPKFSEAHNNLAIALVKTPGRGFDARMHFEEALRLNPDFVLARINLVKLLIAMDRPQDAAKELKAALRTHPAPSLQRMLESLEQAETEQAETTTAPTPK
jgi:tetratricopeptide (TPR) repeat protein